LPEGWVIGEDGKPVTDSHQVLIDLVKGKAALTPLGGIGEELGGYKGYGYATVVEILSAALQGGSFLKGLLGFSADGKPQPYHLGHFFMAVNISEFTELDAFKKTTGDILRQLRASKKAPGETIIYTAGEKEYLAWLERKDKGALLDADLQQQIRRMTQELNLKGYDFLFTK
jgi:LDH2 family malate/lactate/ureidoglycolate dehydrogenase